MWDNSAEWDECDHVSYKGSRYYCRCKPRTIKPSELIVQYVRSVQNVNMRLLCILNMYVRSGMPRHGIAPDPANRGQQPLRRTVSIGLLNGVILYIPSDILRMPCDQDASVFKMLVKTPVIYLL